MNTVHHCLDGDRPIEKLEDDQLGFQKFAQHLVSVILAQTASRGLVIGVEGKWGSGKSSLIALTQNLLLSQRESTIEPIIFSPWLVGNRDELLEQLFDEIARAVSNIQKCRADANPVETTHASIPDYLRVFAQHSIKLQRLAELADVVGVPWSGKVAQAIHGTNEAINTFLSQPLSQQKLLIENKLSALNKQIIIFVDDLDRLEPDETVEMLRLIRAVADFPNVIYVLSYDKEILSKTLETALGIEDGTRFLEKIVQASVQIPKPEDYDLRHLLKQGIEELFANEIEKNLGLSDPTGTKRLAWIIDHHAGRFLRTPRDVRRILNALKLHAVPIQSQIDLPDAVWLQLIRLHRPKLYEWIESYLVEVAALYQGGLLTMDHDKRMAEQLKTLANVYDEDLNALLIDLSDRLPGVEHSIGDNLKVFSGDLKEQLHPFIEQKRLGSPHHYRHYFAFSQPAGSISDQEIEEFITLASKEQEGTLDRIRILFDTFIEKQRPQGGLLAEVLLDRISARSEVLTQAAAENIVLLMSHEMDKIVVKTMNKSELLRYTSWNEAEHLFRKLLPRIEKERRVGVIERAFRSGEALGWLTSILREETFGHGFFGSKAKPAELRIFTPDEFENVRQIMLSRYSGTHPRQLMETPRFLSLLFAWKQAGGEQPLKNWLKTQMSSDHRLVHLLMHCRSRSETTSGVRYSLRATELQELFEVEAVVQRLARIAADPEIASDLRDAAIELQDLWVE